MKLISAFLFVLITSCACAKEITYIGSTPAGAIIRSFLGIPLSEPVDFIRWKLVTGHQKYILHCDYGISKPNTNGFIDRKTIGITGKLGNANNYYFLQNGNKILVITALNTYVLHLSDENKNLLTGNDGWSYTLSRETPKPVRASINFSGKEILIKDSVHFEGRTPCTELSTLALHLPENCYKLKWSVVLYTSPTGVPTTYSVRGTAFRNIGAQTGRWKKVILNNRIIYQLDPGGNDKLYFAIADENIFLFTDSEGKLLPGNEDFSYTLNRK